jgi:hypothetical protein
LCQNFHGKSVWVGSGYVAMGREAERIGLFSGNCWPALREPTHVQFSKDRNAAIAMTWLEVEERLSGIWEMRSDKQ